MSSYAGLITAALEAEGYDATEYDVRHVEGYMRLEHRTLDGLCPAQFDFEVYIAVANIEDEGRDVAEQVAQSYGL